MGVGTLVLLRHGESEWNAKNLFTGSANFANASRLRRLSPRLTRQSHSFSMLVRKPSSSALSNHSSE